MRVVATCTTLPDRYDKLYRTLQTLHLQSFPLNEIYLTLPYKAKRLNLDYPELPSKIKKLCTVVRVDVDYGPITKLVGALLNEKNPSTLIISVDDDALYDSKLVESLIDKHKERPGAAITGGGWLVNNFSFYNIHMNSNFVKILNPLTGFPIPSSGRKIDVVTGSSGVLYQRSFFPKVKKLNELLDLASINIDMFKNDDIVISAYLCSKNIDRIIFKNIPITNYSPNTEDALSFDTRKMLHSFYKCLKTCRQLKLFKKFEDMRVVDSPAFKAGFAIIVLLLIIVICTMLNL